MNLTIKMRTLIYQNQEQMNNTLQNQHIESLESKNNHYQTRINEVFNHIIEIINDIYISKENYFDEKMEIERIHESKIGLKLHYIDRYFIHLNSKKNTIEFQKELNDEEKNEEYKEYNTPHRIGKLYDDMNNIIKNLMKVLDFFFDLNRRGYILKTYEHRIKNFFTVINENITSSYFVFDEEPCLELNLPQGSIFFCLKDEDILEIDYKEQVHFKHIKILGNDKKIPLKAFGNIGKGFQKLSHFIMMTIYDISIYSMGNKILKDLENYFKDEFKKIDDHFTEKHTTHFLKTFQIKNIQYQLSIEENGEVSIYRDPYIYGDQLTYINNMRLNKSIGLIQNGYKDILIGVAKIIIEYFRKY